MWTARAVYGLENQPQSKDGICHCTTNYPEMMNREDWNTASFLIKLLFLAAC